jgi:hypothetical protein
MTLSKNAVITLYLDADYRHGKVFQSWRLAGIAVFQEQGLSTPLKARSQDADDDRRQTGCTVQSWPPEHLVRYDKLAQPKLARSD